MKMMNTSNLHYGFVLTSTLTLMMGCGSASTGLDSNFGRVAQIHQELQIVADDGTIVSGRTASLDHARSADLNAVVGSSPGTNALTIQLGSLYLESQLSPAVVSGVSLQASDVTISGLNTYVGYDKVDSVTYTKIGAIDHVVPVVCDNPLTLLHTELCLNVVKNIPSPTAQIFSLTTDGTNLYTVGSTLDESAAPDYGRLIKYNLDANKSPTTIAATQVLPSYAGTGVDVYGTKVYTTSGTSTTSANMGGISAWNLSDLSLAWKFNWYDARSVVVDRNAPTNLYAINGKTDGTTPSSVVRVDASTNPGAINRTTAITGNDIAESKSGLIVGSQLMIASMGSQGFRVLCKATGATLATVGGVTVAGIPAARTVTNSVAALPGYIFAADGEAGVYIYSFKRNNIFNSNHCTGGVTVTAIGRLKLDSDNSDTTYVNSELSANGIRSITLVNILGLINTRLLMVASGNKGVSMINASDITISTDAVDDF